MKFNASYPILRLKSGRESSILRRHPWVFSGALQTPKGADDERLKDGTAVWLSDERGVINATGFFFKSSIAVKICAFAQIEIDRAFISARIETALKRRQKLGLPSERTTGFRLIHGEGDEMPGVIIDFYNGNFVIDFQIEPWRAFAADFAAVLSDLPLSKNDSIYVKGKEHEGLFLRGSNASGSFLEDGLQYEADWVGGQKTGFFLDQRENRILLRRYSSGAEVLNAFSYTGGFSVAALAGGAASVSSLDSSERALQMAEQNVRRNFPNAQHTLIGEDAFKALEAIDNQFDIIVLDPPAFAKHRDAINRAARGYQTINNLAFRQIRKGGLLFTFSCSQMVDRELFRKAVFQAGAESRRSIRVLHELHQAPCHPVSLFHPEGEYLKGLVLSVG